MIEKILRPMYQKVLVMPLVNLFDRFHPNVITILAILTGVSAAVSIVLSHPWLAAALLLLSGYFDSLDGTLARAQQCASPNGAVLDIVGDRIVEFSIMLGLFLYAPAVRGLPVIMMLGATLLCITSFLVVGLFVENCSEKSFHYSGGIIERLEAFIFFIIMILVPSSFVMLAWIYTALVLFTAAHRVWLFMQTDLVGE